MKNAFNFCAVLLVWITLSAFSLDKNNSYVGNFGVSETDPSSIRLEIRTDKTFSFRDFSNPSKKIDVSGNWEYYGDGIRLKDFSSRYSFHTKWKLVNNGKGIKSKKGMTFYTLCRND